MKTLLLTCNVRDPYACLVDDGALGPVTREADYVELIDPYTVFPDNAVARVVGGAGHVDHVVFVGKPFLFMERLASLHAHLFPSSYRAFSRDLHTYIDTVMRIPALVRQAVEENDLVTTVNYEPCYYVRLDDALAHATDCEGDSMVITCLTDTFEGPSFCCFARKQGETRLAKELDVANSFGNLLRIHVESCGGVSLGDFVDLCDRRAFVFRKRNLTVHGNALTPTGSYGSARGTYEDTNTELLLAVLSRLVGPLVDAHGDVVMVTDVPVPPRVMGALPSVEFRTVDRAASLAAAYRYFARQAPAVR